MVVVPGLNVLSLLKYIEIIVRPRVLVFLVQTVFGGRVKFIVGLVKFREFSRKFGNSKKISI